MQTATLNKPNIGKRIHQELETASQRLDSLPLAVTIYGGAQVKQDDPHYMGAQTLAKRISEAGIPVISRGGSGIMEAANKGAREGAHGVSEGINITLPYEAPNSYADVSLMLEHSTTRKIVSRKHSRAFIFMPGGVGTLGELFEALTLMHTGKTPDVPVILFGSEFWDGLLYWLENTVIARGLIPAADFERRIKVVDSVDQAMKCISEADALSAEKSRLASKQGHVSQFSSSDPWAYRDPETYGDEDYRHSGFFPLP